MNIFLDTSSLLKLYHKEDGTEKLLKLISENVEQIYLSELTKVEFSSAIWKKVRLKEYNEEGAKQIIQFFEKDYIHYRWIPVENEMLNSAKELIKQYGKFGLRTLDAIQLACAVSEIENINLYKTADKVLRKIFDLENLPTE